MQELGIEWYKRFQLRNQTDAVANAVRNGVGDSPDVGGGISSNTTIISFTYNQVVPEAI